MHISDFLELSLLEQIMEDWSKATGMATIAVDNEGNYITKEIGFTDFCMKHTRGSAEGLRRCTKCDNTCTGTYFCHAGLMDFSIDIMVGDTYLGKIIGGQVLPGEPDEDKFRSIASELGIDPDLYIDALRKVPVKTEASIRAAAKLLGDMINLIVNFEYRKASSNNLVTTLEDDISQAANLIEEINEKSQALDKIESKQKILSLNASIEAARAGEFGRGFAVVATEFGKLAVNSGEINKSIKSSLKSLTTVIEEMEESSKN
ncbi:MAG: PocR ligand-binding domain-containing protein [Lachnospiraceae bacterium]|nr:PocR ligand-binding domain-containing protein [Lachnospiraceae bacterium]